MINGIELLKKIKNNELKFNQKINVYFDNTLTGTLDLEAVLTYRGDEVLWSENTFRFSMLYDDNYLFEIVEYKPIIEKINLDREPLKGKEVPRAIDYLLEGRINEIIDYINRKEDK